jgi:hypothetical protein
MDIESVKNTIVECAGKAWEAAKSGKNWMGRNVKGFWNNHLVPTVTHLWKKSLPHLKSLGNLLRSGCGVFAISAAVAVGLYVFAENIFPDEVDDSDPDNEVRISHRPIRAAITLVAAVILIGGTITAVNFGFNPVF